MVAINYDMPSLDLKHANNSSLVSQSSYTSSITLQFTWGALTEEVVEELKDLETVSMYNYYHGQIVATQRRKLFVTLHYKLKHAIGHIV